MSRLWCALLLLATTTAWAGPVSLRWDAPTTGDDPTAYTMYRKVGTGAFVAIATIDVPLVTHTDPAPALGVNTYRVTAVNLSGESAPSNPASVTCKKFRGRDRRCTKNP